MSKITYNDLSVAYMLLNIAKDRNAFKPEEINDVDLCIKELHDFLNSLKNDLESRSVFIEDPMP